MKFLNLKILPLAVLAVLSMPSFAGWGTLSTVTKIVVTQNGGVNVSLSPELSGCVSQSGYGGKYASLYPDHPGFSSIHSNLLAAYMSGKEVQLWYSDGNCKIGEAVLGGAFND